MSRKISPYYSSLLLLIFLFSCSGINKISNRDIAYLYKPNYYFLHPQFVLYNFSNDSTRLYAKINTKELLYKKEMNQPFFAHGRLEITIYSDFDSKESTGNFFILFDDSQTNDSARYLIQTLDFPVKKGMEYVIEAKLSDVNRGQFISSYLQLDKKSNQSPQNFLVAHPGENIPLFRNYVNYDEPLQITCSDSISDQSVFIRLFNRDYPIARAPFSMQDDDQFSYRSGKVFSKKFENKKMEISLKEPGTYHLQFDTLQKQGLTFFRFDHDFPNLTDAGQLIETLRYITTIKEYNEMQAKSNKKNATDEFWLDVAGNEERAKELIRVYYTRVQNSNRYFTSYLDGWKSDRGLIYIIFGAPSTVYRSANSEFWDYGQNFLFPALNFTFSKVKNPFSDNDYILARHPNYEPVWYRAVDAWRNGRVYNDD